MANEPNETNETEEQNKDQAQLMAESAALVPAKVPAKFLKPDGTVDIDKFAQSYRELERSRSQSKTAAQLAAESKVTQTQEAAGEDDIAQRLAELGNQQNAEAASFEEALGTVEKEKPAVDWTTIEKEVNSTGRLSDDSLKALRGAGVPDSVIKSAVRGFQAQANEQFESAGKLLNPNDPKAGKETLNKVLAYVNQTYPLAEKQQILAALRGPAGEATLLGLKAKWEAATRVEGKLIDTSRGTGASPGGNVPDIKPWGSHAERDAAMRDPKYISDPNYQKMVMARSAITKGVSRQRVFETLGV